MIMMMNGIELTSEIMAGMVSSDLVAWEEICRILLLVRK